MTRVGSGSYPCRQIQSSQHGATLLSGIGLAGGPWFHRAHGPRPPNEPAVGISQQRPRRHFSAAPPSLVEDLQRPPGWRHSRVIGNAGRAIGHAAGAVTNSPCVASPLSERQSPPGRGGRRLPASTSVVRAPSRVHSGWGLWPSQRLRRAGRVSYARRGHGGSGEAGVPAAREPCSASPRGSGRLVEPFGHAAVAVMLRGLLRSGADSLWSRVELQVRS